LKTRYFIFISYKGTLYHGWQIQPNSVTVQQKLEEALTSVLKEKICTTGAGRTDTGVHAKMFCAHFDCIADDLDKNKSLIHRLNSFLPEDISVSSVRRVRSEANARFSATSRTYKYYITRTKDPFLTGSSWYLYGNIDVESMNKAGKILLRHSDFTSFSKLHSGAKTNICRVLEAGWQESGNCLIFTIKADRFLRNMVRAIVGTMVQVGFGKIEPEEINTILLAKDRGKAGQSAPARGLFLVNIEYPDKIFM
jgi:tRNA pseudouridine38-40 synthase